MPTRSSLRPEDALRPRLIRREAIQLGIVALVAAVLLATGSTALHVVSGVISVVAAALASIAGVVAWRVGGRSGSLALYVGAVVVFGLLAFLAFS